MNPTCDQCSCAGVGICPMCQRIKAAVLTEGLPPAQRRRVGPASVDAAVRPADRAGLVAAARAAMDGLTVLQRQVLVLRAVDGLPVWRVARRLHLPARMVHGLFDAAEDKLTRPSSEVAS